MGNYVASHIVGRNAYHFINDYGKISHNTTLDVVGDFQLGFQIKPDDYKPDGVLFSKNDSSGVYLAPNITIHTYMTNYYLYVEISDGTNKLAYKTNDQVFLSYKPVQVDVQWKQSTKTMLIKKDGLSTSITLYNPDSNYLALASSFGSSINVLPNADMLFAYSVGLTAFRGIFYGGVFINAYVSDDDIYTYYQSVKDTMTVAPTDYILFSSINPSSSLYSIYKMNSNGSSKTLMLGTNVNLHTIQSSIDGAKVVYTDSEVQGLYTANKDFTNKIHIINGYKKGFFSSDNTKLFYNNGSNINFTTDLGATSDTVFASYEPSVGSTWSFDNGNISLSLINGSYKIIANASYGDTHALVCYDYPAILTAKPSFNATTHLIVANSNTQFSRAFYSLDGTKIGLSMKVGTGKYNLYILDSNGANLTQITNNTVVDMFFSGFSPDSNRILYYDSNNNIFTSGLDNSLIKQITSDGNASVEPSWVYN